MAEATQTNGLSVQDAVRVAASHLQTLFPNRQHVLLEEVELSEDDRYWSVTLSFIEFIPTDGPGTATNLGQAMHQALGIGPRRYKILKVDRVSGQVRSVKIRELEHV
jgi:hypothetical protein